MLRVQALREFKRLASQNHGMKNAHIKHITYGLLGYFFPINSMTKQNRAMRYPMCKPWSIISKCFSAWLTEMNNFLPLLPGSEPSKKIPYEDLNEIIFHTVTNV